MVTDDAATNGFRFHFRFQSSMAIPRKFNLKCEGEEFSPIWGADHV
jgi:hypothetical protein